MAARPSFPRKRRVVLALVLGLWASACGTTATDTTTAALPEADQAPAAPAAGLNGEFATVGGTTIDLATHQGENVVLWFWAPW